MTGSALPPVQSDADRLAAEASPEALAEALRPLADLLVRRPEREP